MILDEAGETLLPLSTGAFVLQATWWLYGALQQRGHHISVVGGRLCVRPSPPHADTRYLAESLEHELIALHHDERSRRPS